MRGRHISKAFEEELKTLRRRLLLMAARVQEMIKSSVQAFVERDPERAERTIELDHEVNRDEIDIDAFCLQTLARRQPVASDLRFLTLALKMVTDLERIGDLAVNICERCTQLSKSDPYFSLDRIGEMGETVSAMVQGAIEAFVDLDAGKAREVIAQDDEVDDLYHQLFRQVLQEMTTRSPIVERGIQVQSAAKYLERIGDHATNLAEEVVFLVEGRDIRHGDIGRK